MSTEHVLKQFSLTDQVAIVIGGGQGLEREIALALSEIGANIRLIDRCPCVQELQRDRKSVV